MAEEKNNNSNLAAKSAQAANTVRGAVKTGKAIAGTAKGAAAGGPYGAVAGLVWGNRHLIGKIILITIPFERGTVRAYTARRRLHPHLAGC